MFNLIKELSASIKKAEVENEDGNCEFGCLDSKGEEDKVEELTKEE
jgi:hypothetical protein